MIILYFQLLSIPKIGIAPPSNQFQCNAFFVLKVFAETKLFASGLLCGIGLFLLQFSWVLFSESL